MRKTLIALAATAGVLGFGTIGASALTPGPVNGAAEATTTGSIQKADWYCGPHCQYSRHRRWDESRHWRNYHRPYYRYGYNGGSSPYHYYR